MAIIIIMQQLTNQNQLTNQKYSREMCNKTILMYPNSERVLISSCILSQITGVDFTFSRCRIWRENDNSLKIWNEFVWQVYRLDDFLLLELSPLFWMYQWTPTSQTHFVIALWVLLGPAFHTQSPLTAQNALDAPPREETMVSPMTLYPAGVILSQNEEGLLIGMDIEWKQTNLWMVKR